MFIFGSVTHTIRSINPSQYDDHMVQRLFYSFSIIASIDHFSFHFVKKAENMRFFERDVRDVSGLLDSAKESTQFADGCSSQEFKDKFMLLFLNG